MDIIEKYPDKPWNMDGISRNPNITMDIIEKYPDKPWNWEFISCNPNITMEFIENNPDGSVFVTRLTNLPPYALTMFLKNSRLLFTCYDPCGDHTPYRIDFPTTNDLLANLHQVLLLLYMAHSQY